MVKKHSNDLPTLADDIMMFIKLYSPHQRTVIFLGHLMMNFRDPVGRYAARICEMAKLAPDTQLNFYEVSINLT